MTDLALLTTILEARTRADIDRAEAELIRRFGSRRTRYLGDNEANWSSVSGAVDPRGVVFERVTNMWDALIEAEAQRQRDFTCQSPQEASARFLAVPMAGVEEMTEAEQRVLAAKATVQLVDSDDSVKRPGLIFRDFGIGLAPSEMPDSILSLERSNKLRKPYLHGIFGKGGSVVCMFSVATVIVSRKQPDLLAEGHEDLVTVAIVREDEAEDMGLPFFRYLVDPETDLPLTISASEVAFEPGTLVMHLGYQAEKMGRETWQLENSIYAFAETLLFRPTLPYQLQDARSGDANKRPESRRGPSLLRGLGQRLDRLGEGDAGLVEHSRAAELNVVGVGRASVRWSLFEDEDNVRRRAARGHRVLFNASGHAHHVWDKQKLKGRVPTLRRVGDRLLVEVDTSAIPQRKLRRIFSSFREATLKSPEATALEQAVAEWLADEPDLAEAEDRLTREAVRRAGGGVSQNFRRRLNQAFRGRIGGLSGGTRTRPPRPPRPPRPIEDLHDEPTAWTGPETIQALPGQRRRFIMQCNAVDGFVPERAEVSIENDLDLTVSIGDLRRGRLQVAVETAEDADVGEHQISAKLSFLRTAGGYSELTWPIELDLVSEIAPPEPSGGGTRRRTDDGEIAFLWMSSSEDNDWTAETVGALEMLTGDQLAAADAETYGDLRGGTEPIPTICLNSEFRDYAAYKRGVVRRVSDEAMALRAERYALGAGVAVANLCQQEEQLKRAYREWEESREAGEDGEEPPKPMTAEQLGRALEQAARGVVALLPDFDRLLGDAAAEEERDPAVVS